MELITNVKTNKQKNDEHMESTGNRSVGLGGSKGWFNFSRISGCRKVSQVKGTA